MPHIMFCLLLYIVLQTIPQARWRHAVEILNQVCSHNMQKSQFDNGMVKEGRCLSLSTQQEAWWLLLNPQAYRLKFGLRDVWWTHVQLPAWSAVLMISFDWSMMAWYLANLWWPGSIQLVWELPEGYILPRLELPLDKPLWGLLAIKILIFWRSKMTPWVLWLEPDRVNCASASI